MTELLTAAQMRAIEQAAIESGEVTGLELMERAGRGVVEAVFGEWPELGQGGHHAVVLCGPGNNGGDGFVIARRLRDKGWQVEVMLFGDAEALPADARTNYDVWQTMGVVTRLSVAQAQEGERPALFVDALFGTGVSRAIPLECVSAVHAIRRRPVGDTHPWLVPFHYVAVECPSGLDCDSGGFVFPQHPGADVDVDTHWAWWKTEAEPRLLHPDLVVTFHRKKLGHVLQNPIFKTRVVDIGLGLEGRHSAHLKMDRASDVVTLLEFDRPAGSSRKIWPGYHLDKSTPGRNGPGAHKYSHGHALVLAGGPGKGGAARLAARGALRIGAGLVTLACPQNAYWESAAQMNAVMVRGLDGVAGLRETLEDDRINALCLGPGMGLAADTEHLVLETLKAKRATVLDADALTRFQRHPEVLFGALHETCVLTPHGGEFAKLFPDLAERLNTPATTGPAYSKVDATRDAAARAGCTVLFKGPDTVIADPGGRCSINSSHHDRAAPWLATAGSGDVLAGFITGLLARGFAPMEAAETAAWLHTECALSFGPGLIAEDLPEELPKVFRAQGL
ncbi:MAG: NAD(P)H-hydrate dehydratase [Pseudomonadota bacterium]